jgi:hypothetical protein
MYNNSDNTTMSYGHNYPSLMLSGQQHQQQQSFNDHYTALILEEVEKLYNELITKLKNEVMANAAVRVSSLPLSHIITTETNP